MKAKEPPLRIGTRGSRLALIQARIVESRLLAQRSDLRTELVIIKTQGDKTPETSLKKISGQGIFTKELDLALREGRTDLAVHSLKDLPTTMHESIELAAVTKREAAEDAFLSNRYSGYSQLPEGARIGTGSPRRKAQILAKRPDIIVLDIRGNVETRLRKLDNGEADGLILACAGLIRLGFEDRIRERLSIEDFVPPPGQGALGVTIRKGDEEAASLAALVQDPETALAVEAERAFLLRLGGGCKTPIACHALIREEGLEVFGFVASPDGRTVFQDQVIGLKEGGGGLGKDLAETLLSRGADRIVEEK